MEAGVASVRQDFEEHGIEIEVLHGGEIALDRLGDLSREELERFTIGQTGRYLLVEFPYSGWPLGLEQQLFELRLAGIESRAPTRSEPPGPVRSGPARTACRRRGAGASSPRPCSTAASGAPRRPQPRASFPAGSPT